MYLPYIIASIMAKFEQIKFSESVLETFWSLFYDSWQVVETKLRWLLSAGIRYHMLLM